MLPEKLAANNGAPYEHHLFVTTLDALLVEPDVVAMVEDSKLRPDYVRTSCGAKEDGYVAQLCAYFAHAHETLERLVEARAQGRFPMAIVRPFGLVPGLLRLLFAAAIGAGLGAFIRSTPGAHGADAPNAILMWVCGGLLAVSALLALAEMAGRLRGLGYLPRILLGGGATALAVAVLKRGTSPSHSVWFAIAAALVPLAVGAAIWLPVRLSRDYLRRSYGSADRQRPTINATVFSGALIATMLLINMTDILLLRVDTPRPDPALATLGLVLLGATLLFGILGQRIIPAKLANDEWEQADQAVREELRSRVLLPHIRALYDNALPSYETALPETEADGFSQVFDPIWEVPTASTARLHSAVAAIPSGSIGIAGPRGVGKTTLLDSFCAETSHRSSDTLRVKVSAPVEYSPREFLLHLYAKVCRAAIQRFGGQVFEADPIGSVISRPSNLRLISGAIAFCWIGGVTLLALFHRNKAINPTLLAAGVLLAIAFILTVHIAPRRLRLRRRSEFAPQSLRSEAQNRLRDIEYQQTLSAEIAGAVKLPAVLEGSVKRAHGMTRHPKGLPEIVESFRDFLALVAKDLAVIVGIDELDKIENHGKAQQFLNDIKSIFGVRGCRFIVSVSEDAMASFERRGLPFRDIFDSAFDEIVSVGHLTYAESADLIGRRRARIPVPHKGLCFCLSGGLPRDLIRAARSLVEHGKCDPNLAEITRRMIAQDLAGKANAVASAAQRIDLEPATSELILWCDAISADVFSAKRFSAAIAAVTDIDLKTSAGSLAGDLNALRRLAREMAAYAYYCYTMVEFFTAEHAAQVWKDAVEHDFDALAKARRTMALNPLVGWSAVTAFRRRWQLAPMDVPLNLSHREQVAR